MHHRPEFPRLWSWVRPFYRSKDPAGYNGQYSWIPYPAIPSKLMTVFDAVFTTHFSVALTIIYTTERGNHLKELGDTYFGPKGRLIYDWAYLNPALFSDKNPFDSALHRYNQWSCRLGQVKIYHYWNLISLIKNSPVDRSNSPQPAHTQSIWNKTNKTLSQARTM